MKPAEELAEIEVALQDMDLEDKGLTQKIETLEIEEIPDMSVGDRLIRADEIEEKRKELTLKCGQVAARRQALEERKAKLEVLIFDDEVKAFIKQHNADVRKLKKKSREYNEQLSSLCDVGEEVKEIANSLTVPRKYRTHPLVLDSKKCLPAPIGSIIWGIPGKNETKRLRLPE